MRFYNTSYGDIGWIDLTSTGAITASIKSLVNSNINWTTTMSPTTYDVDNDQWHHVALVLDRTNEKLVLYVDGVERASADKPTGYDRMRDNVGTTNLIMRDSTNLILDEVRVLNIPRTAQEIADTWFGTGSNFSRLLERSKKSNKAALTTPERPQPSPPKPPDIRKIPADKISRKQTVAEESIRLDKR
jgi:hypothetical protein